MGDGATAGEEAGVRSARPMSPKYEGYQEGCPSLIFRGARAGGPVALGDGDESGDEEDEGVGMTPSPYASLSLSAALPLRSAMTQSSMPLQQWLEAERTPVGTRVLHPAVGPPTAREVASSLEPSVIYRAPFFGVASDIPDRQRVMHNRIVHLDGNDVLSLCELTCSTLASESKCVRCRRGLGSLQRTKAAPPASGRYSNNIVRVDTGARDSCARLA